MSNSELCPLPTFLEEAPKSVLKALDPSEALRAALIAANNDPAAYGSVIALHEIQSYLGAAKLQQRRIERIRGATHEAMRQGRRRRGDGLFAEVHFYLICWARIYQLACSVRRATGFQRIRQILRQYRTRLKDRTDARNHLEHFERPLRGKWEKTNPKPVDPNDLLNMTNSFLTYGGQKLDVGPNSIRLLTEIVAQFQQAVLYDSLEALEATDQRRLSRLLQRADRDVSVARATQKAKRMLGGRA